MTEEDIKAMQSLGITQEQTVIYHFAGYKYQSLQDAIKYAKQHQHLVSAENSDSKADNETA